MPYTIIELREGLECVVKAVEDEGEALWRAQRRHERKQSLVRVYNNRAERIWSSDTDLAAA